RRTRELAPGAAALGPVQWRPHPARGGRLEPALPGCTGGPRMTLYLLAVFLHVVGALGLFVAMGLEWVIVVRVRRAGTAEQARDWLGLLNQSHDGTYMPCRSQACGFHLGFGLGVIRWLSPASMAAILLAGIYMA